MLEKIFSMGSVITSSQLTLSEVLCCVLSAIVLGLLISVLYMFTHRKSGYSQGYVLTSVMLPAIISIIILVVGDSVSSALSLAGVFTLVRFRSAPGDPKDITYVFFAMAVGLCCGMGYIGCALFFFVLLGAVMLVIYEINLGAPNVSDMTLKITIPENLNYMGLFDRVLTDNTTQWRLRRVKTTDFGTLFDLVYSVKVKNDIDQKKFIDDIRALNGNLNVTLVLYKYDDQIYQDKK